MAIELTQAAVDHVSSMLQQRGAGIGIRLSTKQNGCTGYAYVVDYADDINDNDRVFDSNGVKVVVNEKFMHQLDGMTVDYQTNNVMNSGFDFINPNVMDSCGCGESFSFKTG